MGKNADMNYAHGTDAFTSMLQAPCTLAKAIEQAAPLLREAAEAATRFIMLGTHLALQPAAPTVPAARVPIMAALQHTATGR